MSQRHRSARDRKRERETPPSVAKNVKLRQAPAWPHERNIGQLNSNPSPARARLPPPRDLRQRKLGCPATIWCRDNAIRSSKSNAIVRNAECESKIYRRALFAQHCVIPPSAHARPVVSPMAGLRHARAHCQRARPIVEKSPTHRLVLHDAHGLHFHLPGRARPSHVAPRKQ